MARFDVVIVTRAAGQYHDARQLVAAAKEKAVTSGYGSGTGQVVAAAFSQPPAPTWRALQGSRPR